MAKRKRSRLPKPGSPCRVCGALPAPDDFIGTERPGHWYRRICPSCREERARQRQAKTAARLLDNATTTVVERDGKQFTLHVLPSKRRSH